MWPGVTSLPDWKPSFPNWKEKNLTDNVPGSTPESTEMLAVRVFVAWAIHQRHSAPMSLTPVRSPASSQGMLVYDPAKRMSAKAALKCDYFRVGSGMKL